MPVLPSYRNQSIDLLCKSMTGFYMRATLAFNGLSNLFIHLLIMHSSPLAVLDNVFHSLLLQYSTCVSQKVLDTALDLLFPYSLLSISGY